MMGFPGSGKTTAAKCIHDLTGAVHLWADKVRRERLNVPTHSHEENIKLYDHLNEVTSELLKAGNSVVFDTSFNYYKDRQKLRQFAKKHSAKTMLIWVQTPKELAKQRATQNAHNQETRVLGNMPVHRWEKISDKLEPPHPDEEVIEVDGTKVTKEYIKTLLNL